MFNVRKHYFKEIKDLFDILEEIIEYVNKAA